MDAEFREALRELRLAKSRFDSADEDHFEFACFDLARAEKRVASIICDRKNGVV